VKEQKMEKKSIFGIFLLLIAMFYSAAAVFGQETTGSIEGFVKVTKIENTSPGNLSKILISPSANKYTLQMAQFSL